MMKCTKGERNQGAPPQKNGSSLKEVEDSEDKKISEDDGGRGKDADIS